MRMTLSRPVCPRTMVTAERGTLASRATRAISSLLALPRWGAELRPRTSPIGLTLSAPARVERGLAETRNVTLPLPGLSHAGQASAGEGAAVIRRIRR